VFEISPNEGITLQLNTKDPQHQGKFKPILIDFHTSRKDVPEAYENLIYDALRGDPTFFAHWDEVELSWKWVQPILNAFEENLVPLHPYSAGSFGPDESDQLLAKDGYHWWFNSRTDQNIETVKGEEYAYHTNS
jgi:glucose-6-phosphate 1-dehydrogenase